MRASTRRGCRWICCVIAPAALALAGCSAFGSSVDESPRTSDPARQHPTVEGIPIPNGFRYVDDKSIFFSSGAIRAGIYEFSGSTDVIAVYRFYKDYMGQAGFTLRQEWGDRGEYYLRFDSSTEECMVKLLRERGKTILIIRLDPKSSGSADHNTKAPPTRN